MEYNYIIITSQDSESSTSSHTLEGASLNKDILAISEMAQESSIHEDIPDRIVTLVQEIMDEKQREGSVMSSSTENYHRESVFLNIWDFAGQAVYYTTHQVGLFCSLTEHHYL